MEIFLLSSHNTKLILSFEQIDIISLVPHFNAVQVLGNL